MALYQNAVVNKYLSEQNKDILETQYALYKSYFLNSTIQHNIIKSKEEEFQEGFLRELFVKILGYTINPEPDFNLRTELKNEKDSKKADGAIIKGDKVLAVIELKSTTTTDLNKIEIQAFNYKNNQQDCRYVITSNFQKIRFYIDNAIEYLEWDLFKLDFENFKLLYLCLSKLNIFNDLPATIKKESLTEEENVTKKLYKEYSNFRKSLFNSIVEYNPAIDKLLLFKKTQKLLDRFLFLFFAEDRMLVPPNSVRLILEQWTKLKEEMDAYQPLYERFKLYFGYLNTGHTGKLHDIFAYNGGLFAEDEILDVIKIDDTVLYDSTLGLSRYDYNSEVDVNILGHIFEHSLTEIEELEREITSNESPTLKATKRKKDGVFYTPKYITKYIVENTVGGLCRNKKGELIIEEEEYHPLQKKKAVKVLLDNLNTYKEWLLHIAIVDPACGSGAFLNQALEFLIAEHKWISELEANITGSSIVFDVENSILENNLFGVDINEESVEIAKLSLWLRTARKGRKLNSLNNNIKCGNSLIDDVSVAGEKAFNWKNEFPQIFEKGGFDVIIGNPPYGIILNEKDESYLNTQYKLADYKTNLYILFIEMILNRFNSSTVGLIIPKSLLFNSYYKNIREYLVKNVFISELFSISDKVFEDAEVGGSLMIFWKKKLHEIQTKLIAVKSYFDYPQHARINSVDQIRFLETPNSEIVITSENKSTIKDKIVKGKYLSYYFDIKNGLNPGNVKSKLIVRTNVNKYCKRIIWGKDFNRYTLSWSGDYVIYDDTLKDRMTIEDVKSKAGMNSQKKVDFALRAPDLFETEKIIIRKTGDSLICHLDTDNFYFDTLVHGIYPKSIVSLKAILAILNSKPATLFYRLLHDIKGKVFAKISIDNLDKFPIPETIENIFKSFEPLSDVMLSKNKELQVVSKQFSKLITSKIPTLNLNTKLDKWHTLTFLEFSKELSKQKVQFTLQQESEWLIFFEQEKQKALTIKNEIDKTAMEIDRMVYQLYGLTEDEILIIESN